MSVTSRESINEIPRLTEAEGRHGSRICLVHLLFLNGHHSSKNLRISEFLPTPRLQVVFGKFKRFTLSKPAGFLSDPNLRKLIRIPFVIDHQEISLPLIGYYYSWFSYGLIKNMIMQIMINLPQILMQPLTPNNLSLC